MLLNYPVSPGLLTIGVRGLQRMQTLGGLPVFAHDVIALSGNGTRSVRIRRATVTDVRSSAVCAIPSHVIAFTLTLSRCESLPVTVTTVSFRRRNGGRYDRMAV